MNGVHIADYEIDPTWLTNPELRAAVERAQRVVNESTDTVELIKAAQELVRLKAKYGRPNA